MSTSFTSAQAPSELAAFRASNAANESALFNLVPQTSVDAITRAVVNRNFGATELCALLQDFSVTNVDGTSMTEPRRFGNWQSTLDVERVKSLAPVHSSGLTADEAVRQPVRQCDGVQTLAWAFGQITGLRKWVGSLCTSGAIPDNHVGAGWQRCTRRIGEGRPERRRHLNANLLRTLALSCAFIGAGSLRAQTHQSVEWRDFVRVSGQSQPVPQQWLDTEEGRIAHSLRLPDSLPQAIPFDFDKAKWRAWLPGVPKPAVQYFDHLCNTEAGQWIFKTVQNVEGLYFARPKGTPATEYLTDPYAPEMPWIQRIFILQSDRASDHGTWFVQPPMYNYLFVEQPRRDVEWQARISEPYIRLFGYTREMFVKEGQVVAALNEKNPMQVVGIPRITARYGYTWRGLKRLRDREFGIAGGELLIYDIHTREVLAVRRQFLIASRNPRGPGRAMWEIAARCREPSAHPATGEFSQFAFDVLKTINPSTTKKE